MDYLFKALEAAIENAAETRRAGVVGPPGAPAAPPPPQKKRRRAERAAPENPPEPPGQPHIAPPPPKSDGGLVPLFEDGKSLVRALVAAEVLGPPVALREPSTWSLRPNEPSI